MIVIGSKNKLEIGKIYRGLYRFGINMDVAFQVLEETTREVWVADLRDEGLPEEVIQDSLAFARPGDLFYRVSID